MELNISDYIQSFITAEIKYISDLNKMHVQIKDKLKNPERFYDFFVLHSFYKVQLLNKISNCISCEDIVNIFIRNKLLFELYHDLLLSEPYRIRYLENECLDDFQELLADFSLIKKRFYTYNDFFGCIKQYGECTEIVLTKVNILCNLLKTKIQFCSNTVNIGYIMSEFILREEAYVEKLSKLLMVFDVIDKAAVNEVNGQAKEIMSKQTEYLADLKRCEWDCDLTKIMKCFYKHMSLFELYAEDQRRKNIIHINAKQADYDNVLKYYGTNLFVPISHIMAYPQYFERLSKFTKHFQSEILEFNEKIVSIAKKANDYAAINSIYGCNVPTNCIGQLINRCTVTNVKKGQKWVLFLFQDALVITEIPSKETLKLLNLPPTPIVEPFLYKDHIMRKFIQYNYIKENKIEITKNLDGIDAESYLFTIEDEKAVMVWLDYLKNITTK